jgi:hypothetical protein
MYMSPHANDSDPNASWNSTGISPERSTFMAPKNPSSQLRPTDAAVVRLDYFGSPALLPGEDPSSYDGLLAGVLAKVEPKDILEEIWVGEFVDHN